VDLEQKKMSIGRPKLRVFSGKNITLVPQTQDSSITDLYFEVRNLGSRLAFNIKHKMVLITYNADKNLKNVFLPFDSGNEGLGDLQGGSKEKIGLEIPFKFNKAKLIKEYGSVLLVVRFTYKDLISNEIFDEEVILIARLIGSGDEQFYQASNNEIAFAKKFLKELKLKGYLAFE
jgi:hypothetical protein